MVDGFVFVLCFVFFGLDDGSGGGVGVGLCVVVV